MHHALQTLERLYAEGHSDPLGVAKSTFAYYWDPEHLPELGSLGGHPELVHGIDEWLPRQNYGGLRAKGLKALEDYFSLLRTDTDATLLALELNFRLPIDLDELGTHFVTGTADRVALRRYYRKPYVSIEDFKTGKQQTYLRYNVQFTVYCWASLQRDFWKDFPDADERWQLYANWARRGRWFDVAHNKPVDAGWRAAADYARMKVALKEYVKANNADSFPLTMKGDVCLYCDFRDGTCGGVAVPDEDAGKPTR